MPTVDTLPRIEFIPSESQDEDEPLQEGEDQKYSEELQDIISKPPSWLLRWGMTIFIIILISLIGLTIFIRYPDTIKTNLKVSAVNSPRSVVSLLTGKIVNIFVENNQQINKGQTIAYLESTANHSHVLSLLKTLKSVQTTLFNGKENTINNLGSPNTFQLGEMQNSYQKFYLAHLSYKASILDGFYLRKRDYLHSDLINILKQKEVILNQKTLQEKELKLANEEFIIHQELALNKVIAPIELKREESKFISSQIPLQNLKYTMLLNGASYTAKKKELMELDKQILEEKEKYIQEVNSLISEIDSWKNKYIISAPISGKIEFIDLLQENQFVNSNQELFYINPKNSRFFGEMAIPQDNMGKVEVGQKVLIKLKSYPYEEYGILNGNIISITDVPIQDTIYTSKVNFDLENSKMHKIVKLKNGMAAEAEIIVQESSLFLRIINNIIKIIK